MAGVEFVKVKSVDEGMRLNRWFMKYYPGLGIGRLNKLLRTKQVKVDGKKTEANFKLSEGQEVRVPPLDNEKAEIKKDAVSKKDAEFILSMVVYRDANLIVLNKPSGIAVQGGSNTNFHIDGMLDALKFGNEERPKLVHRIDKDTSGILVLARTREFAEKLTKAFKEHSLEKTYLAFVYGVPKRQRGEIDASLEKVGERVHAVEDGKKAVTSYRVLDSVGDRFSLIEAKPLTGRTHQIRAHMEYIGTPIVGDRKYFLGERRKNELFSDKLHLHAYKIDLSCLYKSKLEIKVSVPQYFDESLKTVGINFKE